MVGFAFLPQNLGKVVGTYEFISMSAVSVVNTLISDGNTQYLTGNRIHLNLFAPGDDTNLAPSRQ